MSITSRVRVTFDRVRAEDREAVERLLRLAPELSLYYRPQLFDRWLREGDFIKAVDADGNLVGVIHARHLEGYLWLEGIAVSPDIRRKGIARQLASYVISSSGEEVVRVMAHERNAPSNQLALSLYFKPVDYVYFCDGKDVQAKEIAEALRLREVESPKGVPGYVDDWAWRPIELYRGRFLGSRDIIIMETEPVFVAVGDLDGYRRFGRVRAACSEGFIVYELRLRR